jgi:hypothetical protein
MANKSLTQGNIEINNLTISSFPCYVVLCILFLTNDAEYVMHVISR